jgi:sugar/nucleoside kinase (ribokinase family)
MAAPPTALVLGAVSRDLALTDPGAPPRPGGAAYHAGRALVRLGAATRVVTRLAPADTTLVDCLRAEGVALHVLPSRVTTTYANHYGEDGTDRHELRATSDSIRPEDVPRAWRAPDLLHIGPLHPMDLIPETVDAVGGLRGLDLQGLVRIPASERLRASPALGSFVTRAHVVQVSERELPAVLDGESLDRFVARHRIRELLVTRGARGVTVITPAGVEDVAAVPAVVRSPAGAGDVFLAAYLLARVLGAGPREAAHEACAAAARALGATP